MGFTFTWPIEGDNSCWHDRLAHGLLTLMIVKGQKISYSSYLCGKSRVGVEDPLSRHIKKGFVD